MYSGKEILPSSGKVTIGNNLSFSQNVMALKGVTIGDNCFIGANSLVTKDISANTIAVSSLFKENCTLDEYYEKNKIKCIEEVLVYAESIQERIEEFLYQRISGKGFRYSLMETKSANTKN